MRFSTLIVTLYLANVTQCYVASDTIRADNNSCITVEQIEVVQSGLLHYLQQNNLSFPGDFPKPKDLRGKEPKECVPKNVSHAAADAMVRISKEHGFENRYAELMGHPPALLFKRARDCPSIEKNTQNRAENTWSCYSAPHYNACKNCVALTTVGFIAGVGVCLAKKVDETVPCCVVAATVFISAYSNTCLNK